VTKQTEVVLGEAFAALLPHLDERQRRLALGAAARVLGYGGVRRVARVARVAESTVARGAGRRRGCSAWIVEVRRSLRGGSWIDAIGSVSAV
jgi:hypothetical protein